MNCSSTVAASSAIAMMGELALKEAWGNQVLVGIGIEAQLESEFDERLMDFDQGLMEVVVRRCAKWRPSEGSSPSGRRTDSDFWLPSNSFTLQSLPEISSIRLFCFEHF